MTRQLFDQGIFSVIDEASAIGIGWQLSWYEAGTAVEIGTYTTPDGMVQNSNPVLSDADGRFPQMWLDPDAYKYVLANELGVILVTVDDFTVQDAPPEIDPALETFLAGDAALPIANGGTGQTSAANAIAALGGLPVAGGTMTGNITRSTKGVHLYWNAAGQTSGRVFISASGDPDPTSLAGDWWLKY